MARFPTPLVAPIAALPPLALFVGCAESFEDLVTASAAETACEIRGATGEPHVDREAVRAWLRAYGVARSAGETTSDAFDHGESPEAPRLCPNGFGSWEGDAFARVLPPVRFADDQDHQGFVWAVVGREPLSHVVLEMFLARVGPNDDELRGTGAGYVRLLTLSVREQQQERGSVVLVSQHSRNGHVSMSELAPAGARLDELVVVDDCESLVDLTGEVVLASVDGNPLRLRVVEGRDGSGDEGPELRLPWLERSKERTRDPNDEMVPFEKSD